MRIQIHGAGMAGSYLYFLLQDEFEVGIDDVRKTPDCRCAWGIAYEEAKELYKEIGVSLDDYVLSKPKYGVINGVEIRNKNIVIFDRAKLLSDLWSEMEFKKVDADLEIDATGFRRAFLPKIENDRVYPTIQSVEVHEADENIYTYSSKTGYAWAFPLGNNRWHIGAGDLSVERARELVKKLRSAYGFDEKEEVCSCSSGVRLLPPSKCLPFIRCRYIGVGEAIGCVSGFGEGNAPALKSAKILKECLVEKRFDEYEKRILEEFKWIEVEHKFVEAVQKNRKIRTLYYLFKVVGIERKRSLSYSLRDILSIIKISFKLDAQSF